MGLVPPPSKLHSGPFESAPHSPKAHLEEEAHVEDGKPQVHVQRPEEPIGNRERGQRLEWPLGGQRLGDGDFKRASTLRLVRSRWRSSRRVWPGVEATLPHRYPGLAEGHPD